MFFSRRELLTKRARERARQPMLRQDATNTAAARYRATPDGLVPWRARPETFRRNCIARIPPLDAPEDPHGRA